MKRTTIDIINIAHIAEEKIKKIFDEEKWRDAPHISAGMVRAIFEADQENEKSNKPKRAK